MKKKESHTLRNGIIATVAGGIILSFWPPFLTVVKKLLMWIWQIIVSTFVYLNTEHLVYGWVIVILGVMSLILAINIDPNKSFLG